MHIFAVHRLQPDVYNLSVTSRLIDCGLQVLTRSLFKDLQTDIIVVLFCLF